MGLYLGFLPCSINLCAWFLRQEHTSHYCVSVVQSEVRDCESSSCDLSQDGFGYLRSFLSPYIFF